MEHIVLPEEDRFSLRDVLLRVLQVSSTQLKSAKWDGRITVDGIPAPVNQRVSAGQLVAIAFKEDTPAYPLRPYDLPLSLPYQDEHLLVIDKPAPLASQSSLRSPDDTLENALYAHFGCPADFVYRPVNRLDKGTSGLMLVARDAHTQHRLQEMLHSEDFQRIYLAVVEGHPPQASGLINAPIGKENAASIRRVITPDGKPSRTRYQVLETRGGRSLVRLVLDTGRTHQIRVHMAYLGCPVCGDFLYGTELAELPRRFALHSHEVTLTHPLTGERLRVTSPLPDALRSLLQ